MGDDSVNSKNYHLRKTKLIQNDQAKESKKDCEEKIKHRAYSSKVYYVVLEFRQKPDIEKLGQIFMEIAKNSQKMRIIDVC
jgi:hypothetical protein